MGDNADETRAENVPRSQQSSPLISISPQLRQRVILKIINTLRGRCTQPGFLPGVETIARKFEAKVLAIASDEKDYLRRIAFKMKALEGSSERSVNASPAFSASGAPNQLHSASSDNVQSENIKHDEQKVQSQNPSQLQPHQINNSNSKAMTATQGSESHFTNQSSNLMTTSRMPPNSEKKAPDQLTPSNLPPVSLRQDPILHSQQPVQRNHVKPLLEDQVAQCQPSNQHVNRGNIQHHQNIHKQLPYSPQGISRATASGPTMQSEQPEVSSAYHHQSVTNQQYESWQRDIAHQRKSVPPQQKSMPGKNEASREQSSTFNNQQNGSQPNRAHNLGQQQPCDLANAHPQRSMAESNVHKEELKQQTVQPHAVPSVQSHAQLISQQKAVVVKEEKNHCSGVDSMSQSLPMSGTGTGTGTIQLRSLPSEASKRIDTSSAVERHRDTEGWREGIHQKIMAMKKKFQTAMVDVNTMLDDRFKLLDIHPNDPNKDIILKRLKEAKLMVVRIFRFLNLPKEEIMPVHGEKLEQWEHLIVNYLNKFFRPKAGVPQPLQSLELQTHSSQVQLAEEVRNVESQPDQTRRHVQLQKNVSGSSLSISRDVGDNFQAQTQPPTSLSPSSILVDCNDDGKNLGNNSQIIISDQRSANQSPIERLLKAASSISPQAFKSGMDDIFTVACIGDVMESSAPRSTSKTALSALGQDLGAMTGCRLQARNVSLHDGCSGIKTWTPSARLITSMPLGICNDQDTCDKEPTSEKHLKRRRVDSPHKLLSEEIRKVNQRLIDIVVEKCKEEADVLTLVGKSGLGIVVKCCYTGVSVNLGTSKAIILSRNSFLIQPLHLLVPTEYPDCSPVLLDKLPSESGDIFEDLSDKARARLDIYLRGLNSPFSVGEVARKWELCARDVVIEYAEKFGGGTFSSRYGTWENCLDVA